MFPLNSCHVFMMVRPGACTQWYEEPIGCGQTLRTLDGITYWVLESLGEVYDFVSTNLRAEWEKDAMSDGRDLRGDKWLKSLQTIQWRFERVRLADVTLNPRVIDYFDPARDYNFSIELSKRTQESVHALEQNKAMIWLIVLEGKELLLRDGYCRYSAVKKPGLPRGYAYVGARQS